MHRLSFKGIAPGTVSCAGLADRHLWQAALAAVLPMHSGDGTFTPVAVIVCCEACWRADALGNVGAPIGACGTFSERSGPGTRGPIAGGKVGATGAVAAGRTAARRTGAGREKVCVGAGS
jgi:hypothetical protein